MREMMRIDNTALVEACRFIFQRGVLQLPYCPDLLALLAS